GHHYHTIPHHLALSLTPSVTMSHVPEINAPMEPDDNFYRYHDIAGSFGQGRRLAPSENWVALHYLCLLRDLGHDRQRQRPG
ncbi:hypothetical protein DFQ26_002491, partial [Actinomortierella ambigua]